MARASNPVPQGHHTATPGLTVKDGNRAIEFYKKAFGAEEVTRMNGPGGKGVMHAALKIGDSMLFLNDEFPGMNVQSPETLKGTTQSIYLYVQDVDSAFNRAVSAGARVVMPVTDMFWGDRFGKLADPFGHEWGLATHVEDLTDEEVRQRSKGFMEQMAKRSTEQTGKK